jgi:Fe-S oxidoreductase
MNLIKLFITIYRFLFLDRFIELSSQLLLKFGFIGKKIVFINSIIKINTKRKKISSNKVQNKKILFFEGCFNKYINPGSKNATLNILEELGYEPLKLSLGCCGITNCYSGHFKEFEKQANNIINKIPQDIEAIVCDCDSCLNVLKNYNKYFKNAEFIAKKTISLSEFLIINGYNKTSQKNQAITYHKPCHGDMSAEEVIKKLNNITYKPIKHQSCCGFAGEFAFKYYKLSEEISKNKAEEILNTEAQIILTSARHV